MSQLRLFQYFNVLILQLTDPTWRGGREDVTMPTLYRIGPHSVMDATLALNLLASARSLLFRALWATRSLCKL